MPGVWQEIEGVERVEGSHFCGALSGFGDVATGIQRIFLLTVASLCRGIDAGQPLKIVTLRALFDVELEAY